MITKPQFDKLLDMVMLDLEDEEYTKIYNQMDQIIGFVDKLNELDLKANTTERVDITKKALVVNTNLIPNKIWLSNVQHPITWSMIQIKFKRA
jgi:beta-xylosidase